MPNADRQQLLTYMY